MFAAAAVNDSNMLVVVERTTGWHQINFSFFLCGHDMNYEHFTNKSIRILTVETGCM